jgi:hypothetical protein
MFVSGNGAWGMGIVYRLSFILLTKITFYLARVQELLLFFAFCKDTMPDEFSFTNDFQDLVIACLIRKPDKFFDAPLILKPKYFHGVQAGITCRCALEYFEKNSRFPTWETLGQLVSDETRHIAENRIGEHKTAQEYIEKLRGIKTGDVEFVRSKIVQFARERATISAIKEAISILQNPKDKKNKHTDSDFVKMFEEALSVGKNLDDLGIVLHDDADKVVDKVTSFDYGVKTGYNLLNKVWPRGWGPGWLIVPLAPPKRFKCLGKGTGVLMYNGSVKPVEDIRVGDRIMGDDSRPRKILTCGKGRGPLYRVSQGSGKDFICNDAHVLCVKSLKGDVKEIPAEEYAQRSKAKWFTRSWKGYKVDGSRYRISVKPVGEGDYYGFTIDGNQRFLLDDFTVTHNTTFGINLALNMVSPSQGETIFYYACEISQELAVARALCNVADKSMDYMYSHTDKFKEEMRRQIGLKIGGHFICKSFPSKSVTMADIKAHAKQVISTFGIQPKAIFIDYAETVRPVVPHGTSEHQAGASVYTEARALGAELGCCVIMPDRCNKETVSKKVPNMGSFQGAFQKAGVVDVAIGLCSTDEEYERNEIRYFVFLNRHGKAYQHFKGIVDPEKFKMTINEELPFDASIFEEEAPRRRQRNSDVATGMPDDPDFRS